MRKKAAAPLAALALLVAGLGLHRVVRITPDALVSTLRREAPPGTPAPQLLALLDAMRTEHSQPILSKYGDSELPRPGRRIYAAVRDFRRGKLLADGVFLIVALDSEDRVLDYRAHYVYTGP